MTNLEKHTQLMAALASGSPVSKHLADWYCDAVMESIETGRPLDICLGLRAPGSRSAKNRELKRTRDALLLSAARHCKAHPTEELWSLCKKLSALIRRYPRSKSENPWLQLLFELDCKAIPQTPEGVWAVVAPLRKKSYSISDA